MEIYGKLLKMRSEPGDPINYFLRFGDNEFCINEILGKKISLKYHSEINCVICGRKTSKSFFQGMCYPCFQSVPQAEECVLRPELCKAHEGIARDMEYAKENCLNEHYVYLSYTGDVKVGVTRKSQIPTRWIDQGAVEAMKLASTPNRYLAGKIEVMLKKFIADKTNWRKMLTLNEYDVDLFEESKKISSMFDENLKCFILEDRENVKIKYPMLKTPEKVKSVGFDKIPEFEGVLTGIKGQYLIFEDDSVLNIRKHGGYMVTLTI